MRLLVGYSRCPYTREQFERQGFEVYTCDLRADPNPRHICGDVWTVAEDPAWAFGLFHPMCTYLTTSAAWAYNDPDYDKYPAVGYHQKVSPDTKTGAARRRAREEAVETVRRLDALPYPHAIENLGRSYLATFYRKPDFTTQPYEHGDNASKLTGFWTSDGLPPLVPTDRVAGRFVETNGKLVERWENQTDSGQNKLTPSAARWLERSNTYAGIARAMASQWSPWIREQYRKREK